MEREFKVFVYPEGDDNTYYHKPRSLMGKYASEGYFFKNINESYFVTNDTDQAHMFFIPISCHKMREKVNTYENMIGIVKKYVQSLIHKYPYWNRTLDADHFFVTCHDIGMRSTEGIPQLFKNAIRVVCSSGYNSGYIPHKDIALPQALLPFAFPANENNDIKNRMTLAFWDGHRNSEIRMKLASAWENDTELQINNRIDKKTKEFLLYQTKFHKSKFCICPGSSQGNNARIVQSIHYGCVPVILSNHYDLPFNDILDWRKFSVIVKEKDVYRLKQILKTISYKDFKALHKNVLKVQRHFEWNSPPVKLDAFHMVLYELWQRRHVIEY